MLRAFSISLVRKHYIQYLFNLMALQSSISASSFGLDGRGSAEL